MKLTQGLKAEQVDGSEVVEMGQAPRQVVGRTDSIQPHSKAGRATCVKSENRLWKGSRLHSAGSNHTG